MKSKYCMVLVVSGLMIASCNTEFIDPVNDEVEVADQDQQLTLVGTTGRTHDEIGGGTRISIGDKTGTTYPVLWT